MLKFLKLKAYKKNLSINKIKQKIKFFLIRMMLFFHNIFVFRFRHLVTRGLLFFDENFDSKVLTVNANSIRSVEIFDEDQKMENVITTCYFIHKSDPQIHGVVRNKADINYMAPWYNSINRLCIDGVIFHDGLDENFIKKYQTKFIRFRKCTLGNFSIFEERWIMLYIFLKKTNIKKIFCSDIQDVYIKHNPFNLNLDDSILYAGRDDANKIRLSPWMKEELDTFKHDSGLKIPKTYYYHPVYNPGILGGNRKVLVFCILKMIKLIFCTRSNTHKDMTLINLVLHKYFPVKLYFESEETSKTNIKNDKWTSNKWLKTGYPLNSEYKKYDYNSNAYFIHK